MNVLLISEHYYPKVGGTVSYVENTAINLAKAGINTYLLVPALGELDKISVAKHNQNNLTLLKLGVASTQLNFNSQERDLLCQWIQKNIITISKQYDIQIVHLLFGLFISEALNTQALKNEGIKTFNTIHNIPPFECSNSWEGDAILSYYKDNIRKIGVKFINRKRIQKNEFDTYVTPSNIVKEFLSDYIPFEKIRVIGHGGAEYISTNNIKKTTPGKINILTVGGIVPHKNQHLIPKISAHLLNEGINFEWNIIGPIRNQKYHQAIQKDIVLLGLEKFVFIHQDVSDNDLQSFYENASLYIQLSSEEGFCMTVLDAIAYGIPVLGTPSGAIPEMLEVIDGIIIENNLSSLKPIISHYIKILDTLKVNEEALINFKKIYTWKNAADQLIKLYDE